uniref:Uncharacterized protein n=1 Tax=Oryza barthii TaxID=65489 RepID=A0A0D3H465_9ORYZ
MSTKAKTIVSSTLVSLLAIKSSFIPRVKVLIGRIEVYPENEPSLDPSPQVAPPLAAHAPPPAAPASDMLT